MSSTASTASRISAPFLPYAAARKQLYEVDGAADRSWLAVSGVDVRLTSPA